MRLFEDFLQEVEETGNLATSFLSVSVGCVQGSLCFCGNVAKELCPAV